MVMSIKDWVSQRILQILPHGMSQRWSGEFEKPKASKISLKEVSVCSEALDKLNLNQQRNVFKKRGEKSLEGVSVHWHGDRFSMIFSPKSFPNKMLDAINKTRSLGSINFPAEVLAMRNLIPMSSCEDVISTLQDRSSTEYVFCQ